MDGRSVAFFAVAAAIGATLYIFFAPNEKKKKGAKKDHPPGLVNLGNTCFMNSILQGVALLPSVVKWLQELPTEGNCGDTLGVALELKRLVTALNSGCIEGEDDVIFPDPMLKALHSHGWVISSEQQDAHEFFQVLFSTLDEEMGKVPNVLDLHDIATFEKNNQPEDKSMVHRDKVPLTRSCRKRHLPFHGLLASQLVCRQCGTKCPVKFDGYDSLSLSLPTTFQIGLGLEDLLRKFVCSETVDAVECQGCGKGGDQPTVVRTKFIKRLTLGKLPQSLCIHIQRTYWHLNGVPYKNNTFIKFPEFLDLKPFLYEPLEGYNTSRKRENGLRSSHNFHGASNRFLTEESGRSVFRLMAVIVHMGGVDEGHYVTFRRYESSPGNGHASRWLYTSDELVEHASRDQVLSCCAYMLFYDRAGR